MARLREVLGPAIRDRRLEQGRTLRDVSGRAQVSIAYLSEVERGRKDMSSELLAAVCTGLGVPVAELLHDAADALSRAETAPPRAATPSAKAPTSSPVAAVSTKAAPAAPARLPGAVAAPAARTVPHGRTMAPRTTTAPGDRTLTAGARRPEVRRQVAAAAGARVAV